LRQRREEPRSLRCGCIHAAPGSSSSSSSSSSMPRGCTSSSSSSGDTIIISSGAAISNSLAEAEQPLCPLPFLLRCWPLTTQFCASSCAKGCRCCTH
jgi:hypothetical protein